MTLATLWEGTEKMSQVEDYCLERIQKGLLRFGIGDDTIQYFHTQRRKWYTKNPRQHPISGQWCYSFQVSKTDKRRSTVYKNRLTWMIMNKQQIPEAFIVDHIDGNNQNDLPNNLQLMRLKESHQQGNTFQLDRVLWELSRWFQIVGKFNREPTETEHYYIQVGF